MPAALLVYFPHTVLPVRFVEPRVCEILFFRKRYYLIYYNATLSADSIDSLVDSVDSVIDPCRFIKLSHHLITQTNSKFSIDYNFLRGRGRIAGIRRSLALGAREVNNRENYILFSTIKNSITFVNFRLNSNHKCNDRI
jgi:hypothetical protein